MTINITFDNNDIAPDRVSVLEEMGMKNHDKINVQLDHSLRTALDNFFLSSKPVGLIKEISRVDFEPVFEGEGKNSNDTPIREIIRQSDGLTLFAVTLGPDISHRIDNYYTSNDYVLAYILNTVASLAADNAAEKLELQPGHLLNGGNGKTVLGYSPGYCGWDISGQKQLFSVLKPEQIGITLNESFLMNPIKSVTGILISGPSEIHRFVPNFSFCRSCKTKSCVDRIKHIRRPTEPLTTTTGASQRR